MHPDIAWQLHEQRLQDRLRSRPAIDRKAAEAGARARRSRMPRSIRRVVGRTIIRIGTAIEAEPRQPVASR